MSKMIKASKLKKGDIISARSKKGEKVTAKKGDSPMRVEEAFGKDVFGRRRKKLIIHLLKENNTEGFLLIKRDKMVEVLSEKEFKRKPNHIEFLEAAGFTYIV
jgi:hypothetical protein